MEKQTDETKEAITPEVEVETPETEEVKVSEEAGSETLEDENVTELKPEEDFKEKFYYLAAEMENNKKRVQREKENLLKYGNEKILTDMIAVVDNFERVAMALENDDDPKIKNMKIGMDMVQKQFSDALKSHGLTPLETLGQTFDPALHEAISTENNEEKADQEILKEMLKGYSLNGRVIRAAKVIINSLEK